MANFVSRSLMGKLVVIFVSVALVSISVVGYFSYISAKGALEEVQLEKIDNMRDTQARYVAQFVEDSLNNLRSFLDRPQFVEAMASLSSSYEEKARKISSGGPAPVDISGNLTAELVSKETQEALSQPVTSFMASIGVNDGCEDVIYMNASDGRVLYTFKRLSDLGGNVMAGTLRDTGLGHVFDDVIRNRKAAMMTFTIYQPASAPACFLGVPVIPQKGTQVIGVLAMRLSPKKLNEMMKLSYSAGKTAEAIIVGGDKLMRSDSRFRNESTVLKQKVDTQAVKLGLEGKTGHMILKADYRGEPAFVSYTQVRLDQIKDLFLDINWALVAKIDEAEAAQPATALGYRIGMIGLILALVAGVFGWLIARTIARPIVAISGVAAEVSRGNLAVELPHWKRQDELGALGEAFSQMVENLRTQIGQMLEGVNVLSSAAAEITATAAQLAASATETSSSVNETTTTVEQVKQSAALARDKAAAVAQMAQEAYQVSETGKRAVQETLQGMKLISEQMESVGETVVRLSEHSQTIEEIIETVQDLADQSNLLAVNASIEAARAGEQGKGFAVVAQEIKNLSDQSNQATDQVKSILDDTRKSVSAVVMATEQGSKAVQAGVEGSGQARGSIEDIATRAAAASQSCSLIEATVEQQFVGVNQVSTAMLSIEQAVRQTLDGTTQLETAARRIEELGGSLKEIVESYNLNGRPKAPYARN